MSEQSIWSQLKRILVVVNFNSVDEVKEYRNAIKNAGLNINDCEIIALVTSKKEKSVLDELSSVTYFAKSDINFLGKVKDAGLKKVLGRSFDALFFVGDFPQKTLKILHPLKSTLRIGINSSVKNCTIYINSLTSTPEHLINFARQTLEKTT